MTSHWSASLRTGHPSTCVLRSIGPHVDREVALYAGLFYMRDDHDDSEGGDLELYRFNRGTDVRRGKSPRSGRTRHSLQDDTLCQQYARVLPAFATGAARRFAAVADDVSAATHQSRRRTGHAVSISSGMVVPAVAS